MHIFAHVNGKIFFRVFKMLFTIDNVALVIVSASSVRILNYELIETLANGFKPQSGKMLKQMKSPKKQLQRSEI